MHIQKTDNFSYYGNVRNVRYDIIETMKNKYFYKLQTQFPI